MQITIERPQDYNVSDWWDCCKQGLEACIQNDAGIDVFDKGKLLKRAWRKFRNTRVVRGIVLLDDSFLMRVVIDSNQASIECLDPYTDAIYAEVLRVTMEIRVCFP